MVAARGLDGDFVAWDVGRNEHEHHILSTTSVPADIGDDLRRRARDKAKRIAEALDYVGVLAVEMFVVETPAGAKLLVNEIAPRVHNSGHWTLDGSVTSQFEQHIRAICGFPLGTRAGARPGRDAQPDRRRRRALARAIWANRAPACISTASPKPGPAARWAM